MTTAYTRPTWEAARAAWSAGRYGSEWEPYRQLAAERGFLYPPIGTPEDDREAENPSQRVMVYRAIADTPVTLAAIIGRSRSWGEVVAGILGDMEGRRVYVEALELADTMARNDDPTRAEATETLRGILGRNATPSAPAKDPEQLGNLTPHARIDEPSA